MVDKRVQESLHEAVAEAGQKQEVAVRVIAWLEAVSDGRESFADKEKVANRLASLFAAAEVDLDSEDED